MARDRFRSFQHSRRRFLAASAAIAGSTARAAVSPASGATVGQAAASSPRDVFHPRPGGSLQGFDPRIEILAASFRHNVREVSRLAGGRPLLAVIKNNAYGLGDQVIGPIVASCEEVQGLACVRVAEAIAMREAGVTKPILNMAEVSEEEGVELARRNVHQAVWLDDAPARLDRIAARTGRPVPVHLYLDCGMNREGMPVRRAMPWVETLCLQKSARVDGTFIMFPHVLDADRFILDRFVQFIEEARSRGLDLGMLHAAPSFEVLYLPEAHFDVVRPGNLLYGNFSRQEWLEEEPDLKTVFRLCARVVRLERLQTGDSASFGRNYIATKPTWLALLPVGHTDGYPSEAANSCHVLIGDRLYPVVSVVSSTHALVEIGEEKTVEVGDIATLIGPDDPEITPHAIAEKTGRGFYRLITKMNAFLPKHVV
jgi:alanine racemase